MESVLTMDRKLLKLIVLGLLFAASSAYAETPVEMPQLFGQMYQSFFGPMQKFGADLVLGGQALLVALVILHVGYGGLLVASGTMDLFTLAMNGVKLTLIASILWSAMTPQAWLGTATGINQKVTLPGAIIRGFQTMVTKAATAGDHKGEFSQQLFLDIDKVPEKNFTDIGSAKMFVGVFNAMFKTLQTLLEVPIWPEKKSESSWWNPFNWGSKIAELASDAIAVIVGILFWMGTILMYLLSCGAMILELLGSVLTVGLALAFTPLMVPWLLFRPLGFLFNNWLQMIIIGCLGFVIGVLMLNGFGAFIDTAVDAIHKVDKSYYASGLNIALIFLPLFFGSFIFFMLVPKVTGLASALVAGGGVSGVSIAQFARSASAASAAAKAPVQAGRQIVGGAKAAGNMALSGAQNAIGAASAGVAAVKAAPAAVAGGVSAAKSAVTGATGAVKGAVSAAKESYAAGGAVGAMRDAGSKLIAGGKAAAGAGLNAAKGSVNAVKNKDTAGMAMAKAVAKDRGVNPSTQQLASAASASNRAMNSANAQGLGKNEVNKAGADAARTALIGAEKTKGGQPPDFAKPPPSPHNPFKSV